MHPTLQLVLYMSAGPPLLSINWLNTAESYMID